MKFYLVDYTTGKFLEEAADPGKLAALLVYYAGQLPGHHLAVSTSYDTPLIPASNVVAADYPALYQLKVAQYRWKYDLAPFVAALRPNGLLLDVTDEELQVFHKAALGLDVEQAGLEALEHARELRQKNNAEANVQTPTGGGVFVQRGTLEEMMPPEVLAVAQAEGAHVRPYEVNTETLGQAAAQVDQIE